VRRLSRGTVQQQPGREREGNRVGQADADSSPDKTLRREGACGQHGRGEHEQAMHVLRCKRRNSSGPATSTGQFPPCVAGIRPGKVMSNFDRVAGVAVLALVGDCPVKRSCVPAAGSAAVPCAPGAAGACAPVARPFTDTRAPPGDVLGDSAAVGPGSGICRCCRGRLALAGLPACHARAREPMLLSRCTPSQTADACSCASRVRTHRPSARQRACPHEFMRVRSHGLRDRRHGGPRHRAARLRLGPRRPRWAARSLHILHSPVFCGFVQSTRALTFENF
jgi:hypothetical protein